jgi:hypothetical protein
MLDTQAPVHYEQSGASLLALAPGIIKIRDAVPGKDRQDWADLRSHLETRLAGMRNWRLSWWAHWARLAENILPRRYHWLIVPNNMTRGMPINQAIVDPTGTQAVRVCTAGMVNGLTSPSRPWFKFKVGIQDFALDHDGQVWIDEVERRVYAVMAESNFYDALQQMFEDLIVFGTAPVIIYEDRQDVIRCYNPCAGEYYLAVGSDFRVNTFYRTFVLTVQQIVDMFGLENVGQEVQGLWNNKGNSLEIELIVAHAIEPNFPANQQGQASKLGVVPGGFTFREVYWLWGKGSDKPLSVRGFRGNPGIYPRWATTSNDPYGRSPAMDALPDILQLHLMTKRLAEAIEKQVRPPMLADVALKNEPSSILPGHVTYVAGLDASKGMRPTYEVKPDVQYMVAMIEKIQARIKVWFFNDLFQMISQMEGVQPRNELEINERRGEKLQVLGPVIEKFQNEGASPAIQRVVSIMSRRGLLPPRPRSLQGAPIQIEYISMLALAQRAAATAGMERGIAVLQKMSEAYPQSPPLDLVDPDEFGRDYLDKVAFPSRPIRAPEAVAAIRKQRAQAQVAAMKQQAAAQAATHTAPALAGAAKDLGDVDTGGAMRAIQLMTGQGAAPAGAMQ